MAKCGHTSINSVSTFAVSPCCHWIIHLTNAYWGLLQTQDSATACSRFLLFFLCFTRCLRTKFLWFLWLTFSVLCLFLLLIVEVVEFSSLISKCNYQTFSSAFSAIFHLSGFVLITILLPFPNPPISSSNCHPSNNHSFLFHCWCLCFYHLCWNQADIHLTHLWY